MEEYIRIFAASIIQLCQITYIIIEQMGPYLTVILFSLFLIASAIFIHTHFTYWTRRGVKQKFPFRDDMTKKIIQKRAFGDMVMEIYNRFIGTRYVGFYQFYKPILMLKDPTLIGLVCDRNFFSFKNHTNLVPPNCDPLWNKTVFSLKGRSWHRARSHLEPFFSDRRLWNLFEVTRSYSYDFTNALVPIRSQVLEANFKELFAKCITEIMARSVFDLHNHSFRLNNMFYTKLRESTEDFGTKELIKILLAQTFPCFGKFWNARVFSEKLSSCFTEVSEKIKSHRDRLGIEKLDLISLLMGMKAREINNQVINTVLEHDPGTHVTNEVIERDLIRVGIDLTEETTVAQAMSFFYFGYDVISTVLCFLFYELAQNRDVQERLIKDLDACRAKQKGFSLSELFKVPYLSMVIAETLRKWPPFYFTERYCNKTFNIEKKFPHEKHARISPGDSVWIPIWAIHRDPKYWWNPEVFDPERFLLENHHKRCPNTFIPFGMGPRSCPGAKMAVMQIKIIVNEILTIFEIVPVKNTPHSVVLDHRTFNLSPADGLWLGLKKRFM